MEVIYKNKHTNTKYLIRDISLTHSSVAADDATQAERTREASRPTHPFPPQGVLPTRGSVLPKDLRAGGEVLFSPWLHRGHWMLRGASSRSQPRHTTGTPQLPR